MASYLVVDKVLEGYKVVGLEVDKNPEADMDLGGCMGIDFEADIGLEDSEERNLMVVQDYGDLEEIDPVIGKNLAGYTDFDLDEKF